MENQEGLLLIVCDAKQNGPGPVTTEKRVVRMMAGHISTADVAASHFHRKLLLRGSLSVFTLVEQVQADEEQLICRVVLTRRQLHIVVWHHERISPNAERSLHATGSAAERCSRKAVYTPSSFAQCLPSHSIRLSHASFCALTFRSCAAASRSQGKPRRELAELDREGRDKSPEASDATGAAAASQSTCNASRTSAICPTSPSSSSSTSLSSIARSCDCNRLSRGRV